MHPKSRPAGGTYDAFTPPALGEDLAVVADVLETDRDLLRYARLLHRHAVDRVGAGHRLLRVGDDDELRPGQKSCRTLVKRSMLASSRAASTSSSTQNGLGRLRKIASSRATQVSVFSPPLSSEMLRGSLPGGRATISMPLSRISTSSSRMMSAWPPPKRSRNSVWKCPLTVSRVSANSRRLSVLILSMIFSSDALAVDEVLVLVGGVCSALRAARALRGLRG